jgi:hypothetical protein
MLTLDRLAPAFLAIGVLAMPACASQSYGYRGPQIRQVQQQAYEYGYREGLEAGEKDARSRRDYSPARHGEYRDADRGYRRDAGDRYSYQRAFRRGFEGGYRDGFSRYGSRDGYGYPRAQYPYPSPTYPPVASPRGQVYGSPAFDTGYRDGLQVGRDDARHREPYDPGRSGRYRSADRGYDRKYGSKDTYKNEYRRGFDQGYSQGYRGGY